MLAGSASTADALSFQSNALNQSQYGPILTYPALAAVRFNDVPEYMNVPIRGYGDHELATAGENPRYYEKTYPLNYKPPKDDQPLKEAQMTAKMLRAVVTSEAAGIRPKCKFHCDTDFGCKHCIPADLTVSCPARTSKKLPALDIEWIGDTGSAQDLISERDLAGMTSKESEHPINIMTANGPSSADKQFAVNVPSIGIASDPYFLPDTPAVLSIGQRCMEEGFDFVWKSALPQNPKGRKGLPRR